ncbi:MAG: hypothetical protein IPK82_27300 [Polyangiaceae bacterium]|nr:hypothetical protein [Polyangiaceae bacterium]
MFVSTRFFGLFSRLAAIASLLFLGACSVPPPKPPVRELPPPATALLSLAPNSYGQNTAVNLPGDVGSGMAQAAFAGMAGPTASHESELDLVAAVVGKTFAEAGELPARTLLTWLYWKCGAGSSPGPVNVLVAPATAEGYFKQHLQAMAAIVPAAKAPMTYGVARIQVGENVVQAVALGIRNARFTPIAKSQTPGSTVPVRVTLERPFSDLNLYVDQGGPEVLKVPMTKEADGSYAANAPIPSTPGRYFLEVVGMRTPAEGSSDRGWLSSLVWLPVYAGAAEPTEPDEFIRHPPKNHPDAAAWPTQIIAAYNEARTRLGRTPLQPEQAATAIAQERSQQLASVSQLPPADFNLPQRMADAGLPPRNMHGYVDQFEYVSEYITLHLLQPAARYALYNPDMTTIALGLSARTAAPLGMWSSAEYVFEIIRVDPPRERERLLGLLDAARGAAVAPGSTFTRDAGLTKAAQETADAVCKGGALPTDAKAVFAKAGALDPSLRDRLGVPWTGYDFGSGDAAAIVEKTKKFTHAGAGVCQGNVDGLKNGVMVLLLFAGPLDQP